MHVTTVWTSLSLSLSLSLSVGCLSFSLSLFLLQHLDGRGVWVCCVKYWLLSSSKLKRGVISSSLISSKLAVSV